ncbi:MAG: ABC transporter substrate-binding protein [Lachnospiraceae bacterium]|nr:ABC transporter substrate-binding protein [Lachnospiraceae bacterium]
MKKRTLTWIAAAVTSFAMLAGCGAQPEAAATPTEAPKTEAATPTEAETKEPEPVVEAEPQGTAMRDRSGNDIVVPAEVNTIVAMAPSISRVLIDMGLSDKIVCSDTNTQASYGSELKADVLYMDMMAPDLEQLVALAPDIIFTSGMSSKDGVDAFATVREAGICVADIPSSSSLKAIEEDLIFIGQCVGEDAQAQELVDDMELAIESIKEIAATIPEEEKKTVLFELFTPSADYPTIYTAGPGTYINEMLELVGAINVAGEEDSQWPALTEEAAVGADPQVILTADMYTPDVINVLLTMQGWENVTAIKNGNVYMLDADQVNQPNHHVIDALIDMAECIYPEYFDESFLLRPAA